MGNVRKDQNSRKKPTTIKIRKDEIYELRGLKSNKELNGSLVKAIKPDGGGGGGNNNDVTCWMVRIRKIEQVKKISQVDVDDVISVPSSKLFRTIKAGDIMILKNLVSEEAQKLNGRSVKVKKRFAEDNGRWTVKLLTENIDLSVYPKNLEHIEEEEEDDDDDDDDYYEVEQQQQQQQPRQLPPKPKPKPQRPPPPPRKKTPPPPPPASSIPSTKPVPRQIKNEDGTIVQRIPKRSAILAMGGPEAEKIKRQAALNALATWENDPDGKWQILQNKFDGSAAFDLKQEKVVEGVPVSDGIETFRNDPEKYVAMIYWPHLNKNKFMYVLRAGTVGYKPLGICHDEDDEDDEEGKAIVLQHHYRRLEPFPDNILPVQSRDGFIDKLTFQGKKIHRPNNLPIMPGRGMGIGDDANMRLLGYGNDGIACDPSDIRQGTVGDCWLLSAIACLADYDWAVKRLFRKTKRLEDRPFDDDSNNNDSIVATPNRYTVTLWDLKTWKEVDIIVDERLPVQSDGSRSLLGAKPSQDGKYWVPYLEKAIAMHCGGYDKLEGGKCTDAWPMMTGSRNQFMISKNSNTGKYICCAKYNPFELKWSHHDNSPHDYNQSLWQVNWPKVGGGGSKDLELTQDELFKRVVAWNDNNYLLGTGTDGSSDTEATDGIVDNHAYSIIDSRQNVCDTGIDLLLVRNPWGEGGEINNGNFMSNGRGWDRYPNIRRELNPSMEDNGLFWMTKEEFFRYFPVVYVSALNMTKLQDDTYLNDLKDQFERHPNPKKPRPTNNKPTRTWSGPKRQNIHVDKESNHNKYTVLEQRFSGQFSYITINKELIKGTSIAKGVAEFKSKPDKYLAIHYQTNIVSDGLPDKMHQFTYVYREGTQDLVAEGTSSNKGNRTLLTNVLR